MPAHTFEDETEQGMKDWGHAASTKDSSTEERDIMRARCLAGMRPLVVNLAERRLRKRRRSSAGHRAVLVLRSVGVRIDAVLLLAVSETSASGSASSRRGTLVGEVVASGGASWRQAGFGINASVLACTLLGHGRLLSVVVSRP